MENAKAEKRFLVHIRIGSAAPSRQRLIDACPAVKATIERLSNGNCQLAYTSSDGGTFGYLLKTSKPSAMIRAEIEGTSNKPPKYGEDEPMPPSSPLLNDDCILVLEIGEDFAGHGFSRAWTWLQRH